VSRVPCKRCGLMIDPKAYGNAGERCRNVAACDRRADARKRLPKIASVEHDVDGWWVVLNPGWIIPNDNTHAAVEDRKADALATARRAVPCDCDECQRLLVS